MSRELSTHNLIVLGELSYDPQRERLLRADGTQVVLRAQSASVLRFLAQNTGVLVPRDTLIQTVWDGVAVTDDSLTQCIADIRRAIGDTDRKIVQTVPKRGFILHGVLQTAEQPDSLDFASQADSAAALDLTGTDVLALIKRAGFDGTSISVTSSGQIDAVQTRRFKDLSTAAEACLRDARQKGTSSVLALNDRDPSQLLPLLRAAGSGEVLGTLDIRDMAQAHPQLAFEDLGHIDDAQTVRAFRLLSDAPHDARLQIDHDQPILPTVSVLPLQNIEQSGADLLGMVFADRVIATLSGSEDINVTSRLSTISFTHGSADLSEAARLLKAEFVLSGMYLERGSNLQLNLEFTEVASQRVLWALRLDVPKGDLLEDFEVAYEIVAKIRRAIVINEIRRAHTRSLASLQNYSLMFAAVGLMHRLSPKDFERARDLIDVLSERIPNHPTPLAWRARWHLLRVVQGWSQSPDVDAQAALDCTGGALDLDPENVLALACEGHVLTNILHRLDDAKDRYDQALKINPNDANALSLRGMLLGFQDRGLEAAQDTERALHLAPLDPHRFFYLAMAAGAWMSAGNYEKVETYAKASLRLNKTHVSTLRMLVVAQQKQGKLESVQETLSELMRLQPSLRVSSWLRSSPSANFINGRSFAQALLDAGVPD